MKKVFSIKFLKTLFVALLISVLFSCSDSVEETKKLPEEKNTGKILGKVTYSNLDESANGGIIVTLDKTDGLRALSVLRTVDGRSVENASRTIAGSAITSNDGSYVFEKLEAGTYTVYAASSYSKERAVCTNVVVRSAEETVADVMTLTATGSITGKITLDDGKSGNTGFLVFIAGTSYMAITDDSGNYKISDVPAGNGYQLVVMKNNVIHLLETDVVVNANNSTLVTTNNFTSKELKALDGKDGVDGTSIIWLGSFEDESEIENSQYLNAYFNMKDGCSYIYDGTKWTLLSKNLYDAINIGTVLSSEELTKQNVIITVNITQSDISKIGYVYSADAQNWNTANSILTNSGFISIQPDSNGKYQVIADKNGYYAFAVKNSEGYTAFTEEHITNIDKTIPASVSDLTAKYDRNTKVISVSWVNPADSDFDYAILSYTKNGVLATSNVRITNGAYSLSDVKVDGNEYVFTVFATDKTGNTSKSQTVNVTPADGAKVQSITLNRYHLAYNDPDQTVTATALISNADLIEDGTIVKFQTKDPSGNVTNTVATLNKTQGTATAIIAAPIATSNSDSFSGTIFTVLCKIGDENVDTIHTARFNVSGEACFGELEQSIDASFFTKDKVQIALSDVTSSTKEIVRIRGYNLDFVKVSIQLYDSTDASYFADPIDVDTSSLRWTATSGQNCQIIDTEISVPSSDDLYTVKILFDGVIRNDSIAKLHVYDVPKFTGFSIPPVSVSKKGNSVTATIIGKNFESPNVDMGNLTASCLSNLNIVSNTSFTRNNDSNISVTFTIPGITGKYDITVVYGENCVTGILEVNDFGTYSVGDVLLNDGTIIPYDAYNLNFTDAQKENAVGVLYGFNEYGIPCGWLGLYNSAGGQNSGQYMWAEYNTAGYNKYITALQCTLSDGNANSATFSGSTNGSKSWEHICAKDPDGTIYAAINYPAFNYINNYAITFGLTGEYEEGWYMPSIAELCYIYRNRDVLNCVFDKIGGIRLKGDCYWSSSKLWGTSLCCFFQWLCK